MVVQKQESMEDIILRYQDQFSLTDIINYIKRRGVKKVKYL